MTHRIPSRLLWTLVALGALLAAPTAAAAPCGGDLRLAEGVVKPAATLPVEAKLKKSSRACIRAIARALSDLSGVRSITVAARVADAERVDGSALGVARDVADELALHGIPRRRISAVAPRVGPDEPPGVHISYVRRRAAAPVAHLAAAEGKVRVGPGRRSLKPAATGDGVEARDYIATGKRSLADVALADRSRLRLAARTLVRIGDVRVESADRRSVQVDLLQGSVVTLAARSGAASSFEVITDHAVAGVRGTSFRVVIDGDVTRLETLDGRVALDAQGHEVLVDGGQGSRALAGQPPEPPRALLHSPTVESPLHGAVPGSALLVWKPVTGAAAYVIEQALDADFTQSYLRRLSTKTSAGLGDMASDGGSWFWRVSAVDADGFVGAPSKIYAFRVTK